MSYANKDVLCNHRFAHLVQQLVALLESYRKHCSEIDAIPLQKHCSEIDAILLSNVY